VARIRRYSSASSRSTNVVVIALNFLACVYDCSSSFDALMVGGCTRMRPEYRNIRCENNPIYACHMQVVFTWEEYSTC